MSFFSWLRPLQPHTSAKQDPIQYWRQKKAKLRIFTAILFITINTIGVELATPHYSLTGEISALLLENSEMLRSIVDNTPPITNLYHIEELDKLLIQSYVFSSKLKAVLFLIFVSATAYFIMCRDPLSNRSLLTSYAATNHKIHRNNKLPWIKDVFIYAKNLPTTRLTERCNLCDANADCSKRLRTGTLDAIGPWLEIIEKISSKSSFAIMKSSYRCRQAYYLTYTMLFSALFLSVTYLLVRTFEFYYRENTSPNFGLLFWIITIAAAYRLLKFANPSTKKRNGGAWNKHREQFDIFQRSDEFKYAAKCIICADQDACSEIESKQN